MGTAEQRAAARLREFNETIAKADDDLAEEGRAARKAAERGGMLEGVGGGGGELFRETIVMRTNRPVLAIKKDKAVLVFEDKHDQEVWKARLTKAKGVLGPAIKAVGRIEVTGHELDWVGTGWLVKEDVIVTNRHVASEFAARRGDSFTFKQSMVSSGAMGAAVDFLRELDRDDTLAFKIVRVLHIEPESGPDIAFLAVEPKSGSNKLGKPIVLSSRKAGAVKDVAAIGYPARDSRIPDFALMDSIFGDVYDKKRLAPGDIRSADETRILHDCSTLGGNSGSVVLDLTTGEALGVHFGGRFLKANYAVRADVVKKRLDSLRGRSRGTGVEASPTREVAGSVNAVTPDGVVSIPLQVTVSLAGAATMTQSPASALLRIPDFGEESADLIEDPELISEAKAPDLSKRKGYVPEFIGKNALTIPLPKIESDADDILTFGDDDETVLRYEHFSVVMSTSRRMCRYSAANVNGKLYSGKTGRARWKLDRRIPVEQQIIKECYGNPPKFSRGHMTRREDPAWGTPEISQRGSDDSMHVTNATPQMQAFNSPIWLGLEDYALQNARKDKMKISVFTGPYFAKNDPILFDVKVPVRFWKVIAFIHDETGKLCATGYEMTQRKSLPKVPKDVEEHVFTQFISPHTNIAAQVSIASIEQKAGLSFGKLAKLDPFVDVEAVREGDEPTPLLTLEQIRFV